MSSVYTYVYTVASPDDIMVGGFPMVPTSEVSMVEPHTHSSRHRGYLYSRPNLSASIPFQLEHMFMTFW
jgi:hypothetical protein